MTDPFAQDQDIFVMCHRCPNWTLSLCDVERFTTVLQAAHAQGRAEGIEEARAAVAKIPCEDEPESCPTCLAVDRIRALIPTAATETPDGD